MNDSSNNLKTNNPNTIFNKIKTWFKSETKEAIDSKDELIKNMNNKLDGLETDLNSSSEEKVESLEEEIELNSREFEDIKNKIETEKAKE